MLVTINKFKYEKKNIILIVLIIVAILIILVRPVKEGIKTIEYQPCSKYFYTTSKLPCVSNGVVTACTHAETLKDFKKCCSSKNLSKGDKTFCEIAKINNTSTLGELLLRFDYGGVDAIHNTSLYNSTWS